LIAGGIALLLAQIGATTAQDIACSAPLKAMLEIDLMFGRISAARWG
jgi:F0F1-type ATP synthase membrane subunit c/vacuolar-type H+-ATPase subunit K